MNVKAPIAATIECMRPTFGQVLQYVGQESRQHVKRWRENSVDVCTLRNGFSRQRTVVQIFFVED